MNALATGLAMLLVFSAAAAAEEPSASVSAATETAATDDASIDARMADAMQRVHAGDVLGAQQIWRGLASAAQSSGDARTLDQAERALADIAFLRGHYAEVAQIYTDRLQRARGNHDQRLEADSVMQLALIDRRQGRLAEARTGLEAALALFRAAKDHNGEGETLTHLGLVLLNQGAFVRAIESLDCQPRAATRGRGGQSGSHVSVPRPALPWLA
ncbi:MAG: tetratricopeptide repeat protein [Pseudomarimonas sp.]